jgi:hypothetical protein
MEKTIAEGLKQALARGQSLQQAMESFYYAGYPKENIEAAAREIQGIEINQIQKKKVVAKPLVAKKVKPVQKVSNYVPQNTKKIIPKKSSVPPQKASKYSPEYKRQNTRPGIDWILLLMLFGLFALIGILIFMLMKPL